MMDLEKLPCRKRVELLCDYLDKELPEGARRAISAHRRSCLPCRRVLESLERTVRVLKTLKKAPKAPASGRRAWREMLLRRKSWR